MPSGWVPSPLWPLLKTLMNNPVHSPDVGFGVGWESPACFSSEVASLSVAFFSTETFSLSCCGCSPLFALGGGAEEPFKQGKLDCSTLGAGGVLGRQDESVLPWLLRCDASREVFALAAWGWSPFALSTVTVRSEDGVDLWQAATIWALGFTVEDRSAPANTLEEEHGRGMELLLWSPLWPADDAFEGDTLAKLLFAAPPSFSCAFEIVSLCETSLSIWELLMPSPQAVKLKVVCATEASLPTDTSVFFRYFSMSTVLRSPAQGLLCSVSNKALLYVSGKI